MFDVSSCSLPPADFMQLSVRKSANCLSLITTLWRGGGWNLKKNTNSWKNTLNPSPSSSSAYQSAACTAERRPQELKTPFPLGGCVCMRWSYLRTSITHPFLHLFSFFTPHSVPLTVPIQRKTALCSMFVMCVLIPFLTGVNVEGKHVM